MKNRGPRRNKNKMMPHSGTIAVYFPYLLTPSLFQMSLHTLLPKLRKVVKKLMSFLSYLSQKMEILWEYMTQRERFLKSVHFEKANFKVELYVRRIKKI